MSLLDRPPPSGAHRHPFTKQRSMTAMYGNCYSYPLDPYSMPPAFRKISTESRESFFATSLVCSWPFCSKVRHRTLLEKQQ
ncbi:hypothetical protein L596_001882 [Steinernema carpocapsae]|uniref:Uncharacterized protein n=1 Tax=Steinernema carpocapsae TaxID=34508 RepID=A0A4U8UMI5_STECR|nr:hypothetical protein L596_001882 [Steinernema carpocapsae]